MKNERKFDEFDHFANDYREIHNQNLKLSGVTSDYFSEHKIQILKKNEQIDSIKFLDFGCGDGNSAVHFYNYFPDSNYNGIDISSESINVAKSKLTNKFNFQTFDGINIPFENNTFDLIFTACVFHHIDFKLHQNILNEINRVLKPNGKFYIFEHNPWNPLTRYIVNTCPFDKDAILLNPIYSKKILSKTFVSININYILFFPRNKFFNPFIKLEKYISKIPVGGQYFISCKKHV
jgi:ubiquinone/menaquinone biosynthesis C-methylase UbiE